MTGIIDYGMGNLGSVKRKLDLIGERSVISCLPEELGACDHLILPGVGHFEMAAAELRNRNLWDFLDDEVKVRRKPILGICLGMQLLAQHSEEGNAAGFGWIESEVIRFRINDHIKFKVPHIGWNHAEVSKDSKLFQKVNPDTGFYFVHSYHMVCKDPHDILSTTVYEYPFVSAVEKDNIMGVQFHPEKSHEPGEHLLRNFINL